MPLLGGWVARGRAGQDCLGMQPWRMPVGLLSLGSWTAGKRAGLEIGPLRGSLVVPRRCELGLVCLGLWNAERGLLWNLDIQPEDFFLWGTALWLLGELGQHLQDVRGP